jgi:hypothetical protein
MNHSNHASIEDKAKSALSDFPSDSDAHFTQRAMRAAVLVPEMLRRVGQLTRARHALAALFRVAERTIRRAEFIYTIPEIAMIVLDGRVVIDTAEKIMKNAQHAGCDILTIAWLSAPPKDREAFMAKFRLKPA